MIAETHIMLIGVVICNKYEYYLTNFNKNSAERLLKKGKRRWTLGINLFTIKLCDRKIFL